MDSRTLNQNFGYELYVNQAGAKMRPYGVNLSSPIVRNSSEVGKKNYQMFQKVDL